MRFQNSYGIIWLYNWFIDTTFEYLYHFFFSFLNKDIRFLSYCLIIINTFILLSSFILFIEYNKQKAAHIFIRLIILQFNWLLWLWALLIDPCFNSNLLSNEIIDEYMTVLFMFLKIDLLSIFINMRLLFFVLDLISHVREFMIIFANFTVTALHISSVKHITKEIIFRRLW